MADLHYNTAWIAARDSWKWMGPWHPAEERKQNKAAGINKKRSGCDLGKRTAPLRLVFAVVEQDHVVFLDEKMSSVALANMIDEALRSKVVWSWRVTCVPNASGGAPTRATAGAGKASSPPPAPAKILAVPKAR
jgi:hypothetical protein